MFYHASTDQSLKGIKTRMRTDPKAAAAEANEIIRNMYRTLLTRGMKGCYVYCRDAPLARHLRESMAAYQYAAVSL